ncbi:MAG: indolepyruvate oxidoreductase subunit beta family protein [Aestuariivirga sp.]|uniref:indolepyruvate oxidoreductase subunit beta family protein n=1 Tax=Aestuariivirga sp. TaxID=2650926 RepID=UPI0025BF471A|nr:indolepyruvate oxidoreductase subunit beta family protein [Aestuariivirga sp.]MCA3561588.1 indolepyruvate oxidoreductase subunit beta family protein [Aestuariivirga sp.]
MFDASIPRDKPLTIAILAMGGQGGGVLSDWIVSVAEANGWHAQSTSVPGVAQRTGATLYYIEMLPPKDGRAPVLALMPSPGDVDIVIAAELMEAGRSILRGLVTPDRTLLITSTHRAYAVAEKEKPGESIADPQAVNAAAGIAARRVIAFDKDEAARESGTVISAPLFGALAGSGALPFGRASFEAVISEGGRGVKASLKGFAEGFARATVNELPEARISRKKVQGIPDTLGAAELDRRLARVRALPAPAQTAALAGLKRCIDYQDLAYGDEYLSRLEALRGLDGAQGGEAHGFAFTAAAAKHVANAMAYDDVIGVADLKIRSARFARIATEMKAGEDPLQLTEFVHPRGDEVVSLLPAAWGRKVMASRAWMARIDWLVNRDRRIRTHSVRGFLQFHIVAGLRRFRRKLLRHEAEMRHMEAWLGLATRTLPNNYGLARAILAARRLIKGYSDTHARGLSKFDRVLSAAPLLEARADGGAWMDRLISAALKDENGDALDGALKTLREL